MFSIKNITKKYIVSIFMIILFMFSFLNITSYAAQNGMPKNETNSKVTVYMRIEGYGHTIVPRTKVTVGIFDLNQYKGKARGSSATPSKGWPASRFKKPTVAHALVKLLEQKKIKYDLQDYGWGLYFAMLANEREFDILSTSGWMYRVNGNMPPIGSQGYVLKGGEDIVWYFGAYGYNTIFTELKADKTTVKKGNAIKLTLFGRKDVLDTGESTRGAAPGAQIYVNGKPYKVNGKIITTDKKGNAVIKIEKQGKYQISAERSTKKGISNIVRPLSVTIRVIK